MEPGVELKVGAYVIVGNEEADPAVAEIVTVKPTGVVLVRVLPGPVEDHLHLVQRTPFEAEMGRSDGGTAEFDDLEAEIADAEVQHPGTRRRIEKSAEIIQLATALWQRMEFLGMTVEEVAERSRLSSEDIESIEDNAVDVSLEHLARYAGAVGMRLDVNLTTA